MLRFDIITVLPELMESFLHHSILKRAQEKQKIEINLISLRNYGQGKYRQVDDYSYGGEAGMVMACDPLANAIEELNAQRSYDDIIYLTPDGDTYTQATANRFSTYTNLMLICGHYKGIDQRIRDTFVTKEISIGDYVLSGGELGAAILVDSIGRLIPGVLNDETSALTDSFQDNLLAPPVYTRPDVWRGLEVPEVLLSGNHKRIQEWNYEQALEKTQKRRPDLLN
jgi:tRNA (guanine37-N1)-methyltransferase